MGKIYNIDLCENFLKEVVGFIKQNINPIEIVKYTVVLPNNRSCREFKKYFSENNESKTICFPKIISISDTIIFEDQKISALITKILRNRNKNIPINTIFELALSITKLIKELIINNVDYTKIRYFVPANLMNHWEHTVNMISECIANEKINNMLSIATLNLRHSIKSISENDAKIIVAGISNTDIYTKEFIKATYESENGLIFTIGNANSQNQTYNKEIIGDLPYINLPTNLSTDRERDFIELAEFQNISEEAQAVAISVRKAVYEQKNVLIVAPNRDLSVRIKSELKRWNIVADDSYGEVFAETCHGLLVSLVLDVFTDEFSSRSVLKILKITHSQHAFKMEKFLKTQRSIYPHFFDAFMEWKSENSEMNQEISTLVSKLYNILKNNDLLKKQAKKTFSVWSQIIIDIIDIFNAKTAALFAEIIKQYIDFSDVFGEITFDEYSIFIKKHSLQTSVRYSGGYTDGVVMLGTLEAQLLDADFVIIAGANEDSFISSEKENFWMSNSMMRTLNIPTNEQKDKFIQCVFERLAHKKHVLITRSDRVLGSQQVKYPFLDKLLKLLKSEKNTNLYNLISCVNKGDKKESPQKISSPYANPQLKYRPNKFSVTDIESLKNNAYAFYAKKILKLKELNEFDEIKNLRGNYIHVVLDNFVKKRYGDDIYHTAEETLKELKIEELSFGFWFFRINNILDFVKDNTFGSSISEIWGERSLAIDPNNVCKVICKADRIDVNDDNNGITIIDYKTSSEKITKKSVEQGEKIQLVIEAWIAKNNGFKISKNSVSSVQYWFLKKDCEKVIVTNDIESTDLLVEKTIDGLRKLIYQYNIIGKPYCVNVGYKFDDSYMHLARVKEWLDA